LEIEVPEALHKWMTGYKSKDNLSMSHCNGIFLPCEEVGQTLIKEERSQRE